MPISRVQVPRKTKSDRRVRRKVGMFMKSRPVVRRAKLIGSAAKDKVVGGVLGGWAWEKARSEMEKGRAIVDANVGNTITSQADFVRLKDAQKKYAKYMSIATSGMKADRKFRLAKKLKTRKKDSGRK